jgi:hypothetical protein
MLGRIETNYCGCFGHFSTENILSTAPVHLHKSAIKADGEVMNVTSDCSVVTTEKIDRLRDRERRQIDILVSDFSRFFKSNNKSEKYVS